MPGFGPAVRARLRYALPAVGAGVLACAAAAVAEFHRLCVSLDDQQAMVFGCLRSVAPGEEHRFVGLKNQGATCHLNVALQALYMTPEFRTGILQLDDSSQLPPTGRAVCTVFSKLDQGSRTVSTKPITKATASATPGYVCTRQQDCHDTWLMLCDKLESDLKGTPVAKLVAELFEGRQVDYVRCHKCGTVTNTADAFSNLSLAVPSSEEEGAKAAEAAEAGASAGEEAAGEEAAAQEAADGSSGSGGACNCTYSVLTALRESLKPEQLRGDDQFECEKCKGKQDAERGVHLRTLPPIVSVHMKRFAIHNTTDRKGKAQLDLVKVNTAVQFAQTLDLRAFVTPGGAPAPAELTPRPAPADADAAARPQGEDGAAAAEAEEAAAPAAESAPVDGDDGVEAGVEAPPRSGIYDLYAVLLHSGSLEKGHYWALIKDVDDGNWYRFDDEKVTLLSTEQLEREMKRAYGGADGPAASLDRLTSAYMLLYREVPEATADGPTLEGSDGAASPSGLTAEVGGSTPERAQQEL